MPLPLIDLLWRDHPDAPAGGQRGPRARVTTGAVVDAAVGLADADGAGRGDRPAPRRRARRVDDVGLHARQQPRRPAGPDGRRGPPAHGAARRRAVRLAVPRTPRGGGQPRAAPGAPVAARRRRRPHRPRARHDRQVRPRAGGAGRRSGSTTSPGRRPDLRPGLRARERPGAAAPAAGRRDGRALAGVERPRLAAYLGDDHPLAQRVGAAAGEAMGGPGSPSLAWDFGLARVLDGLDALSPAGSRSSVPGGDVRHWGSPAHADRLDSADETARRRAMTATTGGWRDERAGDDRVPRLPGLGPAATAPGPAARRRTRSASCRPRTSAAAHVRLAEIEAAEPHVVGRVRLVVGDITVPGLGVSTADDGACSRTSPRCGTSRRSTTSRSARRSPAGSTSSAPTGSSSCAAACRTSSGCTTSAPATSAAATTAVPRGRPRARPGVPQPLRVDQARGRGAGAPGDGRRPARDRSTGPASWSATRRTGETQKYDGPYFLATFLRRQPPLVAVVPAVADPDRVRFCLVPRDFVIDAMDRLSVLDVSLGRTYALTDPDPPTVRQLVDAFAARLGKRVVWVPLPLSLTRAVVSLPLAERLMGLPVESLDYFASPTTYDTTHTTTDLAGIGRDLPALRGLRRPAARLHGRAPRARLRGHGLTARPRTKERDMARATPVVVNVSLMGPEWDHDTEGDLPRASGSGSSAAARPATSTAACELVREWGPEAAAVAVTGVRDVHATGPLRRRASGPADRIMAEAGTTPVTDGTQLLEVLQEWAVRRVETEMPGYFTNARTSCSAVATTTARPASCASTPTTSSTPTRCTRLDACPTPLHANPVAGARRRRRRRRHRPGPARWSPTGWARSSPPPATRAARALARRAARDCDVVVATYDELTGFGLEDLAGKTVITSAISPERLADLGDRGVDLVVDVTPQPFDDVTVNAATLEALMTASVHREQHAHQRRPARHDRLRRPGAAAAAAQRAQAQEPVRVRHPPAVAGVPAQRRAAPHRLADRSPAGDGPGREGRGLQPAVHLQPRHRHHLAHRRGGRGLAHQRRRHPPRDDGPQPRVHLPAPARRGRDRAAGSARRSWGWAPSPRSSATPG